MSRRHLLSLPCVLMAAILSPQQSALSQPPPSAHPARPAERLSDVTIDKIIAALHESGFTAQRAPSPWDDLGEILTNLRPLTQLPAVIKISPCHGSPASICALTFRVEFTSFQGVTPERIATFNAHSFAHVYPFLADGLRAEYFYPCEKFPDARFVPMVLDLFSGMVTEFFAPEKSAVPPATPQ